MGNDQAVARWHLLCYSWINNIEFRTTNVEIRRNSHAISSFDIPHSVFDIPHSVFDIQNSLKVDGDVLSSNG
jgi:hypothetical protein